MELSSSVTQQRVTHTQLLSHITHSHHHRDGWGNTKKKLLPLVVSGFSKALLPLVVHFLYDDNNNVLLPLLHNVLFLFNNTVNNECTSCGPF